MHTTESVIHCVAVRVSVFFPLSLRKIEKISAQNTNTQQSSRMKSKQ